jgi:hypothetical protein
VQIWERLVLAWGLADEPCVQLDRALAFANPSLISRVDIRVAEASSRFALAKPKYRQVEVGTSISSPHEKRGRALTRTVCGARDERTHVRLQHGTDIPAFDAVS